MICPMIWTFRGEKRRNKTTIHTIRPHETCQRCTAHKKSFFLAKSTPKFHTWNNLHVPLFFYVRHSVILPYNSSLTSNPNVTTLRWIIWCSHYIVAERQQFSYWYSLGTATFSLKFDIVVPGRWICSSCCGGYFFAAPSSMGSTSTCIRLEKKKSLRCNVLFPSSVTLKQCFFVRFSLFLDACLNRLRRRWHESPSPSPWNTFPVCIQEHTVNLRRFH